MSEADDIKIVLVCPVREDLQCREYLVDENGKPYVKQCRWYQKLAGHDPQTGDPVDEWRCNQNWTSTLLIENSAQQRSTSVAIENFRNEMIKANEFSQQLLQTSQEIQLLKNL